MASAGLTGAVLVSVMVPFTRGSTTTLRPVMVAMVRATASISALAKSSVTLPPLRAAGALSEAVVCACAGPASASASAAATATPPRAGAGGWG